MSTPLQPQFVQPQQQPPVVYPNSVTGQASSSHSDNGSFGTVFIVLAVIVVVSAIACCLGRLCSRRHPKQKPSKHHNQKQQSHNNFRPKERERDNQGDLEFGFEKGLTSKPAGMSSGDNNIGRSGTPQHKPFHMNGRMNGRSSNPPHFTFKGEGMNNVHPVSDGDLKAGPGP